MGWVWLPTAEGITWAGWAGEGPQGAQSASLPWVPPVLAGARQPMLGYSLHRRGGPEGTTPEWPLR